MNDTTTHPAASGPARGKTPTWLVATIAGLVGLFYAYAVWNAIGNLVVTLGAFGDAGLTLNALGWFIWIFAAVFPLLVWGAAFALGYRREPHHLLLLMVTGLAVVAVFWLNVVAYTTLNSASFLG
ncbi:bacitracin resistance protein [Microbacterium sp. HD4P20]|uniref:bacitracin resistance protein n=1 Tax=Microbacterium sp. HD4P20 TaxID=2864874 RepID=UPI0020A4AF2B|nr:bacitracin resistance protein [Microbacterium sp. HD4P20]MCP2636624.1 bacitracin resistance protein [Microbacterium sp. HD4P20]